MAFPSTGVRVEVVVFDGYRYRRYPDSPRRAHRVYFTRAGELLHRAVWKKHRGPVPEGWHVHHKEGAGHDTTDPDDLECLPPSEHHAKHRGTRAATGRRTVAIAQEAAAASAQEVRGQAPCAGCGAPVDYRKRRERHFCGGRCRTRAYRASRAASSGQ